MKSQGHYVGSLSVKLVACLFVMICLAIGAVGIILPIIPGLLFLALAAMIATRHFPSAEFWLRRNRSINGFLNTTDRFSDLSLGTKVQLGSLLCVKMIIDGTVFVIACARRLAGPWTGGPRRYR